jgi:hypothetical protein
MKRGGNVSACQRVSVSEIGVLEYWSIGVLEYWSVGMLACWHVGVLAGVKHRSRVAG